MPPRPHKVPWRSVIGVGPSGQRADARSTHPCSTLLADIGHLAPRLPSVCVRVSLAAQGAAPQELALPSVRSCTPAAAAVHGAAVSGKG